MIYALQNVAGHAIGKEEPEKVLGYERGTMLNLLRSWNG
jgi:hypothetical protein